MVHPHRDLMHNFNLGVGGDLAVSTLVGRCRMGTFDEQGCAIGLTHGARGTIAPQPSSALSSKTSTQHRPLPRHFQEPDFTILGFRLLFPLFHFLYQVPPSVWPHHLCLLKGCSSFLREKRAVLMMRLCFANGWNLSW